jgi:hypothetical protein
MKIFSVKCSLPTQKVSPSKLYFPRILAPEMRILRYYHYAKWTLGLGPTVSLPMQTHPYSGHVGSQFVDLLVNKQQEELDAGTIDLQGRVQ